PRLEPLHRFANRPYVVLDNATTTAARLKDLIAISSLCSDTFAPADIPPGRGIHTYASSIGLAAVKTPYFRAQKYKIDDSNTKNA
ncbi:MAG TPA: hypothetical protein PKU91_05545, partial [Phycisphaerales bacterium]|nr:hypothetical protein [Phycisphaerales bacterium]